MTPEALLIGTALLLVLVLGAAGVIVARVIAVRVGRLSASFPTDLEARLNDLDKGIERIAGEVERGEAVIRDEVVRVRNEDREALKSLRVEMTSSVGMLVEGLRTSFGDLAMTQKERLALLESAVNQVRANAATDAMSLREDVRTTLAQFGDAVTRAITQLSGIQRERLDAVTAEMARLASGSEQRQEAQRRHTDAAIGELRSGAAAQARALGDDIAGRLKLIAEGLTQSVQHAADAQRERLDDFSQAIAALSESVDAKHEALRRIVDEGLGSVRGESLERLRHAIDGEIQSARDLRFFDSVKRASDLLDQAHKAVDEMRSMAAGAGNLRALPRSFDSPR